MFQNHYANMAIGLCVLLGLALLASAMLQPAALAQASMTTAANQIADRTAAPAPAPAPAPKPDFIDDILDVITGGTYQIPVDDDLDAIYQAILAGNTSWLRQYAVPVLESVEGKIDQIQDPHQYPSLSPANIGQPGSGQTFSSLEECGEQCVDWINRAADALEESPPDQADCGYYLDSIMRALPQYRTFINNL